MISAFFPRFCILLVAVFYQTNAEGNSSSSESGCEWNCTIVDWYTGKETTTLTTEERMLKLDVKYRLLVYKHCANQTEVNTSKKQFYWWIWLTDNSEPRYSHGFFTKTFSGVVWFSGSGNKGQRGMSQISCALKHPTKSATNRTQSLSLNNQIALLLKPEAVADSTGRLHSGILYNTEASTNNANKPKNLTESVALTNVVIQIMMHPIWVIFLFYFPVIFCLFPAIEATEEGVHVVLLKGPRIMSLRGCVARYFCSIEGATSLRRLKCVLYLVQTLLLLYWIIAQVIIDSYLPPYLHNIKIFDESYLLLAFYGLFIIRTICVAWIPALSLTEPCLVCQFLGVKHIRRVRFQEEIRQHLRIQPLIFTKFGMMFVRWFLYYVKNGFSFFFSPNVIWILIPIQAVFCLLWLTTILPVIITLSVVCLFFVTVIVFHSCPLATLYGLLIGANMMMLGGMPLRRRVCSFAPILYSLPITMVVLYVIATRCALATMSIISKLVLNLNESLPYVAFSVLILYYLWSCYSSFTEKYQDLALKLYKHYKTTAAVQLQSETKIMKIPKNLFDTACEELMPVRQSVCMLLVKIALILMFVGIVFSIVIETPGVTPVTQAVVTFFSGSFPKLVAIFYEAGGKGNIEDAALDQESRYIVQEYTTRSSILNQVNQNDNLDATNEENAALINPTEKGYGTV